MGMQDRDYYREWLKEKDGHAKTVPSRLPDYEVEAMPPSEPWHPVLRFLLWVVICLGVFLLLRLTQR